MSRAAEAFWEVARMAWPTLVLFTRKNRMTMMMMVTQKMRICRPLMMTPPTLKLGRPRASGKGLVAEPKMTCTRLSMQVAMPTVEIRAAMGAALRVRMGLRANLSIQAPKRPMMTTEHRVARMKLFSKMVRNVRVM